MSPCCYNFSNDAPNSGFPVELKTDKFKLPTLENNTAKGKFPTNYVEMVGHLSHYFSLEKKKIYQE